MNELVGLINTQLELLYPTFKVWGLAEIVSKSNDRFPATADYPTATKRTKIALDEAFDGVIWHREIAGSQVFNEEYSFGLVEETQVNVTLRTIVAYKSVLGEDWKYDFIRDFPDVESTGFLYLDMVPTGLNPNQEAIVQEEEIHTQYNQQRICWNIFTIENDFQFILCPPSSP